MKRVDSKVGHSHYGDTAAAASSSGDGACSGSATCYHRAASDCAVLCTGYYSFLSLCPSQSESHWIRASDFWFWVLKSEIWVLFWVLRSEILYSIQYTAIHHVKNRHQELDRTMTGELSISAFGSSQCVGLWTEIQEYKIQDWYKINVYTTTRWDRMG